MKDGSDLVLHHLATDEIAADDLSRDRMTMDPSEMEELRSSIAAHGMRLPIEVYELSESSDTERWGLISGCRRLAAVRDLFDLTAKPQYATICALVRQPDSIAAAFTAMVEENEIRSDLSPHERGRVAVRAVEQGGFERIQDAVDQLFSAASRAKRSKVRSFAMIHEELGDMLAFPRALSERQGLRLANALRAGLAGPLREALATQQGGTADLEWDVMEPVVEEAEDLPAHVRRGGRPRSAFRAPPPTKLDAFTLPNGLSIRHETDASGHSIRLAGRSIDSKLVYSVMLEIKHFLEPL
ncbi:MAG: ParB/RepB/Spo0J family partition protein [Paracoccaceae bacterium]